jgi:hypothetical protein
MTAHARVNGGMSHSFSRLAKYFIYLFPTTLTSDRQYGKFSFGS